MQKRENPHYVGFPRFIFVSASSIFTIQLGFVPASFCRSDYNF